MSDVVPKLNVMMSSQLPGLLGMEIVEAGPERVVGRMRVRADMCTAGGILHGGAHMAFADTLGAVATVVNMPEGHHTATIESKTNFIGAAKVGTTVTGTARPFHKGRTTQVWQTEITGEDGKLLAVVSQTQIVMPPKAQPPKTPQ
jgi:1,4-dihydroxy-2-naphthoyl-CoA hydrolase